MTKPLCSFFSEYRKIFTIMRNAIFLILLAGLQAIAGNSYSQSTRLSLNKNNVTMKQVLMEIEEKTEFYFLYNSELIDIEQKVDVNFTDEKIDVILSSLFDSKNIKYIINDRHILVK